MFVKFLRRIAFALFSLLVWPISLFAQDLRFSLPEIKELISSGEAVRLETDGLRGGGFAYSDPAGEGEVKFGSSGGKITGGYSYIVNEEGRRILRETVRLCTRWNQTRTVEEGNVYPLVRKVERLHFEGGRHVGTTIDLEVFLQDEEGNLTLLDSEHLEERILPIEIIDSEDYQAIVAEEGQAESAETSPIRIIVPHELMPPDSEEEMAQYDEMLNAPKETDGPPQVSSDIVGMTGPNTFSTELDIPFMPRPEVVVRPWGKYSISIIRNASDCEKAFHHMIRDEFGLIFDRVELVEIPIVDETHSILLEHLPSRVIFNVRLLSEEDATVHIELKGLWHLTGEGDRFGPYKHIGTMAHTGKLSPGDVVFFEPDEELAPNQQEQVSRMALVDTELQQRIRELIQLPPPRVEPVHWLKRVIPESNEVTVKQQEGPFPMGPIFIHAYGQHMMGHIDEVYGNPRAFEVYYQGARRDPRFCTMVMPVDRIPPDPEQAIEYYQQAIELQPDTPSNAFLASRIAYMYCGMENDEKAYEWWTKTAEYSNPTQLLWVRAHVGRIDAGVGARSGTIALSATEALAEVDPDKIELDDYIWYYGDLESPKVKAELEARREELRASARRMLERYGELREKLVLGKEVHEARVEHAELAQKQEARQGVVSGIGYAVGVVLLAVLLVLIYLRWRGKPVASQS